MLSGTRELLAEITVHPDLLLSLLEELGSHRALADHETDLIEEIVTMGLLPFRWNNRLDRALVLAANSPGAIARFARRHGITSDTAYSRLYRIRGKRRGKERKGRQVPGQGRKG